MPLLDAVPVTSCHECVAMLTLPLALFLLLAETAVGGVATVAYLRLTGGLTHGFLKFIAVTYAILGGLAFLQKGKMFCGIVKDELVVRVGQERYEESLRQRWNKIKHDEKAQTIVALPDKLLIALGFSPRTSERGEN